MGSRLDRVERIYRALCLEEPDRVPRGELDIHLELVSSILGTPATDWFEAQIRIRDLLGIDLVNVGLEGGPRVELIGKTDKGYQISRDWLGNEWVESGKTRQNLKYGLATVEAMKRFEMPDIAQYRTSTIERWSKHTSFCVFTQVGGVLDSVYPLTGLENYIRALYQHPETLKHVIEEVYRFNLKVIKMYAEAGSHVILIGDDLSYDSGPFIPPNRMKEFVFPYLAGEVSEAHRLGLPAILHCDGNVTPLMGDIVGAGFDGLHSLQPNAGVDIVEIKGLWGDHLCLMGNLDLDYLLTLGMPEEVEAEVKRLMREVAPGGGYILSTTNVLTRYTPPENALAMYGAARKSGTYPIR